MNAGDEQFHLLVDAVKDYAIFMLDRDGIVSTWNPGAERIKLYRPDEIIGRHFSVFYTEEDRKEGMPQQGLAKALAEGRYAARGYRLRKDGTRFFADVLLTPVYKNGEVVGYAKVTRDVTERHQLEEQLRQRVDELADADKRKDEFIAMLAHELRNPLAPVLTGLAILQRVGQLPAPGQRAIQAMDRQLKLMARLVDDLLQISRITRGKIELRRQPTRLDEIVAHAVELVQPQLQERRQKLELECDDGVEAFWDPQRVVQALSNVMNNASKYSPEEAAIRLRAWRDGTVARITVRDTGLGIRPHMLERIFEVFTQDQPPSGTEMQSGLGIGLALARTVVVMHGGAISATSGGPGKGSTFEIELPLVSVADHEEELPHSPKEFRILVVDDNRDAAGMVADLLEIEGYTVDKAYGGIEALHKADEMHPHMILLDLLMPDLTGYEVIRRVRRHPGGPVVVAVTGHGSEADRDEVRAAGFDEHVLKPVVGDAVLAIVRRFLQGRGDRST